MRQLVTPIVAALLLAGSHAAIAAEKDRDRERAPRHLTADQAIACVKHAVGARAGSITDIDVKVNDNRTVCEVSLVDAKGKKFEAHVDVAANKVIRVKD
jgi:uncharacterized membrane protein YkoI